MFAIVDIETCGPKFAYERGRITDICILVHDGLQVIDKFSTLINPECYISSFYTKLTGITNEMVANAPRFHEVAKEILSFTEGKLFVAHNVSFDYNFIKDEFASLGFRFKRDTMCTVKLSRKLLPGKASYSLGNLCESIGITIENRHRAEGDAVATAKLLDVLLQLKSQSKEFKTASVARIMTSRIDQIKKYILDKLPSSCGVYHFLDKNGEIIYIGKSVDMYARAVSHFNTDTAKSKEMLSALYNVSYIETGSELIALLQESEDIKLHKPRFNSMRKKDVFTHSIDANNNEGIMQLKIIPFEESSNPIIVFTSYASARECMDRWIEGYRLCLHQCGLTEGLGPCFHHQIEKCDGICAGKEEVATYNEKVQTIIAELRYKYKTFMLIDKGRHAEEKSFVLVKNHRYVGYGYMDEHATISDIDDLMSCLVSMTYYPDSDAIIKSWMKQKKQQVNVIEK